MYQKTCAQELVPSESSTYMYMGDTMYLLDNTMYPLRITKYDIEKNDM